MKKRLVAIVLALAVVLAVVPLALAATQPGGPAAKPAKGKPFLCTGTVPDPAPGTLTVTVKTGSHVMRTFVGSDVTFTLAAKARIMVRSANGGKFARTTLDALLKELTPGSRVHVNGRLDRRDPKALVFYAQLVKVVLAPMPAPAPIVSPSVSAAP